MSTKSRVVFALTCSSLALALVACGPASGDQTPVSGEAAPDSGDTASEVETTEREVESVEPPNANYSWRPQMSDGTGYWSSADLSRDGQHAVVVSGYGGSDGFQMFRTNDFGGTWAEVNVGAEDPAFNLVSISDDGERLAASWAGSAASTGNGFVLSSDGGESWSEVTGLTMPQEDGWQWKFAASGDGTTIIAVAGNGVPSLTTDGGKTWNEVALPSARWGAFWVSHDGSRVLAGGVEGATTIVAASEDSGRTWSFLTAPTPIDSQPLQFLSIATSGDRSTIVASARVGIGRSSSYDDLILVSNDGGLSWSAIAIDPTWPNVDSGELLSVGPVDATISGDTLMAGISTGNYEWFAIMSVDAGASWTPQVPLEFGNEVAAVLSGDGAYAIYAAVDIWYGQR